MTDQPSSDKKSCNIQHTMWWTTLIVAVIAVPAFGYVMSSVIPMKGLGEIIIFMIACWFCTFLGMKLMKMPGMSDKVGSKKDE